MKEEELHISTYYWGNFSKNTKWLACCYERPIGTNNIPPVGRGDTEREAIDDLVEKFNLLDH